MSALTNSPASDIWAKLSHDFDVVTSSTSCPKSPTPSRRLSTHGVDSAKRHRYWGGKASDGAAVSTLRPNSGGASPMRKGRGRHDASSYDASLVGRLDSTRSIRQARRMNELFSSERALGEIVSSSSAVVGSRKAGSSRPLRVWDQLTAEPVSWSTAKLSKSGEGRVQRDVQQQHQSSSNSKARNSALDDIFKYRSTNSTIPDRHVQSDSGLEASPLSKFLEGRLSLKGPASHFSTSALSPSMTANPDALSRSVLDGYEASSVASRHRTAATAKCLPSSRPVETALLSNLRSHTRHVTTGSRGLLSSLPMSDTGLLDGYRRQELSSRMSLEANRGGGLSLKATETSPTSASHEGSRAMSKKYPGVKKRAVVGEKFARNLKAENSRLRDELLNRDVDTFRENQEAQCRLELYKSSEYRKLQDKLDATRLETESLKSSLAQRDDVIVNLRQRIAILESTPANTPVFLNDDAHSPFARRSGEGVSKELVSARKEIRQLKRTLRQVKADHQVSDSIIADLQRQISCLLDVSSISLGPIPQSIPSVCSRSGIASPPSAGSSKAWSYAVTGSPQALAPSPPPHVSSSISRVLPVHSSGSLGLSDQSPQGKSRIRVSASSISSSSPFRVNRDGVASPLSELNSCSLSPYTQSIKPLFPQSKCVRFSARPSNRADKSNKSISAKTTSSSSASSSSAIAAVASSSQPSPPPKPSSSPPSVSAQEAERHNLPMSPPPFPAPPTFPSANSSSGSSTSVVQQESPTTAPAPKAAIVSPAWPAISSSGSTSSVTSSLPVKHQFLPPSKATNPKSNSPTASAINPPPSFQNRSVIPTSREVKSNNKYFDIFSSPSITDSAPSISSQSKGSLRRLKVQSQRKPAAQPVNPQTSVEDGGSSSVQSRENPHASPVKSRSCQSDRHRQLFEETVEDGMERGADFQQHYLAAEDEPTSQFFSAVYAPIPQSLEPQAALYRHNTTTNTKNMDSASTAIIKTTHPNILEGSQSDTTSINSLALPTSQEVLESPPGQIDDGESKFDSSATVTAVGHSGGSLQSVTSSTGDCQVQDSAASLASPQGATSESEPNSAG